MTLVELGYPRGKFHDVVADALGWVDVLQDEDTGHLVFVQLDEEGERRNQDVDPFPGIQMPGVADGCRRVGRTARARRIAVRDAGTVRNDPHPGTRAESRGQLLRAGERRR